MSLLRRWSGSARLSLFHVGLVMIAAQGCGPETIEAGAYRIEVSRGSFLGMGCQARTDLYAVDRTEPGGRVTWLGTCGTPRFVTRHLGLPGDPSCFAISADGAALVYLHRPEWCGAGRRAREKPGGVYLHSTQEGDRLLYRRPEEVGQIWSQAPLPLHSIRVSWHGEAASRGGAVRPQNLIIGADGSETPEGGTEATPGRETR